MLCGKIPYNWCHWGLTCSRSLAVFQGQMDDLRPPHTTCWSRQAPWRWRKALHSLASVAGAGLWLLGLHGAQRLRFKGTAKGQQNLQVRQAPWSLEKWGRYVWHQRNSDIERDSSPYRVFLANTKVGHDVWKYLRTHRRRWSFERSHVVWPRSSSK